MTAYLNSFTGSTIASSNASLNTITFIASQPVVNLVWNLNGYDTSVSAGYYAATYLIVNGTAVATPILVLPSAQQVSPGEEITIVNTGTNTIQVKLFGQPQGSSIVSLTTQQSVKVVIQSNTSLQGVWQVVSTSAAGGLATIANLAGRGIATRATPGGVVANVFDTVWPRASLGGDQTLTADQSSQVIVFSSPGTVTLASTPVPPAGTYFILKNVSNGRLTVQGSTNAVMDGVTDGQTFINPGAFGFFVYGVASDGTGAGSWFSMIGTTSVGTSITTSSGLNYNATIVDCMNGSGAAGAVYTMQNQDFGTVISYENVQQNQVVVLPQRVALYVVRNTGLGVAQNITFRGVAPGTSIYNTVVLAGSQYSVLATDGIGNVYPGISSLPGNQVVNTFPGSVDPVTGAVVNGIFFDNDATTGMYSNSQDGLLGISVASTIAGTISGGPSTANIQFGGSFSVPPATPGPNVTVPGVTTVNMTLNGSLTIRDNLNALGGLDGGVI